VTTRPDEQAPAIGPGDNATVSLAVHLRTIELKNAERDDAYTCGYDSGFVDGLETGLRATLPEARAALGVAA
jgi:hypothetical protein